MYMFIYRRTLSFSFQELLITTLEQFPEYSDWQVDPSTDNTKSICICRDHIIFTVGKTTSSKQINYLQKPDWTDNNSRLYWVFYTCIVVNFSNYKQVLVNQVIFVNISVLYMSSVNHWFCLWYMYSC